MSVMGASLRKSKARKQASVVKVAKHDVQTLALLVHPNMGVLSALQNSFAARGVHSLVARDLPTALLALGQHDFSAAVVYQRMAEEGDGWALGSVVRRIFPDAHIAVICSEKDVASLQAAINNRLNQVFDEKAGSEDVAETIANRLGVRALEMVH